VASRSRTSHRWEWIALRRAPRCRSSSPASARRSTRVQPGAQAGDRERDERPPTSKACWSVPGSVSAAPPDRRPPPSTAISAIVAITILGGADPIETGRCAGRPCRSDEADEVANTVSAQTAYSTRRASAREVGEKPKRGTTSSRSPSARHAPS
jgi:hypothetical protein